METHVALIGIDEQTALVYRDGSWEVRGRGRVSILGEEFNPKHHATGEPALGRHQAGELAGRESV